MKLLNGCVRTVSCFAKVADEDWRQVSCELVMYSMHVALERTSLHFCFICLRFIMLASVSCSGKRCRLVGFNCLIDETTFEITLSGGSDFVSVFLIICWMRSNTRVVKFRIALSGVSRSCDIAFVSLS